MIGDRRHDVEGARANGLGAVGVLWGYGSRTELEEAGADVLVESMAELVKWAGRPTRG
jgi:phosphoglycolate phosphatase